MPTFTDASIKRLQPRETAYRVFEGGVLAGFGVAVSPGGGKSFFLQRTVAGHRRFFRIGAYPAMPLSAARERARALLAQLEQGIDPRAVVAPPVSGTVENLLTAWLNHLQDGGRKRWREAERMIRVNAGPLLAQPANAVQPADIRQVLAAIHQRGSRVQANRVRTYLHAMFQYGLRADHDPRRMSDPVLFSLTTNPVSAIPRDAGAETTGERVLSWAEVRAVWHSETLTWPARQAVRLLLLTGARVNEVVQASWSEFLIPSNSGELGLWTLPAARSKNHRTHLIPLSPQVISLITELHEVFPGDWLFPARSVPEAKAPWGNSALAHAVLRWQRESGATDCWRPQDLRRTMKTWAVSAGIERGVLDKVQNHALSDVASRHYDRHDYLAEKRIALNQWAAELTARLAGDNAVVFKAKSAG